MSDIQRWHFYPRLGMEPSADGVWLRYSDHVEVMKTMEQRILSEVIERAELTFRSDIINPVRDIIEPMLEDK